MIYEKSLRVLIEETWIFFFKYKNYRAQWSPLKPNIQKIGNCQPMETIKKSHKWFYKEVQGGLSIN